MVQNAHYPQQLTEIYYQKHLIRNTRRQSFFQSHRNFNLKSNLNVNQSCSQEKLYVLLVKEPSQYNSNLLFS